jgi:hypothetical protein
MTEREILSGILDDLRALLARCGPTGCHWCGFTPHRASCSGVAKIEYVEGLLASLPSDETAATNRP